MSLEDRTNERVVLSMHRGEDVVIDLDGDSAYDPHTWVTVYGNPDDQDFYFNMTLDEAVLFRDRLSLILDGNWWK